MNPGHPPEVLPGAPAEAAAADAADASISMARANLAGVPLFILMMAAVVLPFATAEGIPAFILGVHRFTSPWIFLPWIAAGTVAHELLHGAGWVAKSGGGLRKVRFGFHWRTLTPFAHFTEPIRIDAYRFGIVLPGVVVGMLPAAAGYALDHGALVLFGGLFTGAAAGDALGLWAARSIPAGSWVLDHPTRVGCSVVSPPDNRRTVPSTGESS